MKLKFIQEEGGRELSGNLHAIIWPDGVRWDEVNGFTRDNVKLFGIDSKGKCTIKLEKDNLTIFVSDYDFNYAKEIYFSILDAMNKLNPRIK